MGVAQVERDASQQMCGSDCGEINAQRAEGKPGIGALDQRHRRQVQIAGERFAVQRLASGGEALPGRAIHLAGAVAAGPAGVAGRLSGQQL
ncbi:hypothetical protein HN018_21915 (plasmid) [Lichenicola cladoniae]|uniref:Uncharacterized protein n=1 Tax=Lichenicola cladoniae TaxID=1484109 RepID=A0A6M8HWX6_9PROT|nr:hypothetical protein [Lichenicola cladoniae]NPD68989.1 hypothetical protein [Acetobacteraceae bacterium]QKE92888.1 hypothetical protein HN018_21915 [Lichenicola cladoniae]